MGVAFTCHDRPIVMAFSVTKYKKGKNYISMNINEAQFDMRHGFFGGAPGVLVSGIVWLMSGVVALAISTQAAIVALFLGGMLIHPLGVLLSKRLNRPGKNQEGNPLAVLAMETTIFLFIGLFLAYSVSQLRIELFFPVMLLIIGGRYLIFATIYGMRLYWILGAMLAVTGGLGLVFTIAVPIIIFIGGGIEILFSAVIFYLMKSKGFSSGVSLNN